MYRRPSDDIRELRKRGLPWLASAFLLFLLLIFAGLVFIILYNQSGNNKNILFRWKYNNSDEYEDIDDKTDEQPKIHISPLEKHNRTSEDLLTSSNQSESSNGWKSYTIAPQSSIISTSIPNIIANPISATSVSKLLYTSSYISTTPLSIATTTSPFLQTATSTSPAPITTTFNPAAKSLFLTTTAIPKSSKIGLSTSVSNITLTTPTKTVVTVNSTLSTVSAPSTSTTTTTTSIPPTSLHVSTTPTSLRVSTTPTSATLPRPRLIPIKPTKSVSTLPPTSSTSPHTSALPPSSTLTIPTTLSSLESLLSNYNATKEAIPTATPTSPTMKILPTLLANSDIITKSVYNETETPKIIADDFLASLNTNITSSENETPDDLVDNFDKDVKTLSYSTAAVSCPNEYCSEIGRSILLRGGNAVDAAIATDICMGSVHPHESGLGGSTTMIIHESGSKPVVINGIATSPRSATSNTYAFNEDLSIKGYSAVACPGNLAALWKAFSRYGSRKIGWQDLLLPTIDLLERGYQPSESLLEAYAELLPELKADPIAKKRFVNKIKEGELFHNSQLAQTLRKLASSRDPYQLFYRGELASQIIQELRSLGALLTKLDFVNYEATIEDAQSVELHDGRILSGPSPPSTFILSQLSIKHFSEKYKEMKEKSPTIDYIKNLLDFQSNITKLRTEIGDPTFSLKTQLISLNMTSLDKIVQLGKVLENSPMSTQSVDKHRQKRRISKAVDYVSTHINVIDSKGMSVSLTSTLNKKFGAQRLSDRLGFFWNNHMAEFSLTDLDGEDINSIQGSKKPRTVVVPLIITKNNQIELLFGATKPSCTEFLTTQVILNYLLFDKQKALSFPRFCEHDFGLIVESSIFKKNSDIQHLEQKYDVKQSNVIMYLLYKENNTIYSICDPRDSNQECSLGY